MNICRNTSVRSHSTIESMKSFADNFYIRSILRNKLNLKGFRQQKFARNDCTFMLVQETRLFILFSYL